VKTTIRFAALSCLLLFSVASAQEHSEQQMQRVIQRTVENYIQQRQNPRRQLQWEADHLTYRSTWRGHGSWMSLNTFLRLGGEAELGLTEDQKHRLSYLYKSNGVSGDWKRSMEANPTPEYILAMEAIQATEIPDDPLFERATEEQKNAFREAFLAPLMLFTKVAQADIEETLLPEQMLQVRKLEMQMMSEFGFLFPAMFDPLDLTDDQKEEMNQIAQEMEAEFDRLTMEQALFKSERLVAMYGSLREKSYTSIEEFNESLQNLQRLFVPSETLRKKGEDLHARGTRFVTLLQHRLMNVLTDEQLDKMQKILDETPDLIKRLIASRRAARESQEKAPGYVPGADSWRPGMPLPVEFKEERRTGRFPRSE